jgi:hypothetical protein
MASAKISTVNPLGQPPPPLMESLNSPDPLIVVSPKKSEELNPLRPWQKVFVALAIMFWALYLVYRGLFTFNWAHPVYALAFFTAEVIAFASLARFAYTVFHLRKREAPVLRSRPTVDVLIASMS